MAALPKLWDLSGLAAKGGSMNEDDETVISAFEFIERIMKDIGRSPPGVWAQTVRASVVTEATMFAQIEESVERASTFFRPFAWVRFPTSWKMRTSDAE